MKDKKKIVKIIAEIETDDDFNLDELTIGRLTEQNNKTIVVLEEGTPDDDKYFKINDYLKIDIITDDVEKYRKEEIATLTLGNMFKKERDYIEAYSRLDEEERKEVKNNIIDRL